MTTIGYCSPFVPPEWIAAHGLAPRWLPSTARGLAAPPGRGLCPFAAMMAETACRGAADAVVLTTTCDQMRRIAEVAAREAPCPVFLMNVPATWQTETARACYLDELRRLGRWLTVVGGAAPGEARLASCMARYDEARHTVLGCRGDLPPRLFSEALLAVRGETPAFHGGVSPSNTRGIPLAILGGPLAASDFDLFDLVETSGGRIVLDATDSGERTLPAPFDRRRMETDPLAALADAYFGSIHDAFRRPNDGLYHWLSEKVAGRAIRGILFRRYVWCDLWHAELFRLKQWSPVPLMELDVVGAEGGTSCRTALRVESFLEMLR